MSPLKPDEVEKIHEDLKAAPKKCTSYLLVAILVCILGFVMHGYLFRTGEKLADKGRESEQQSKPGPEIDQHTTGNQSPNIVSGGGDVTVIYEERRPETEELENIVVHPKQVSFTRTRKSGFTSFTVVNEADNTQFNFDVQLVLTNLNNLFEKVSVKAKGKRHDAYDLDVDEQLTIPTDVLILENVPDGAGNNTITMRFTALDPKERRGFQVNYECTNVEIMKEQGALILPLKVALLGELGSIRVEGDRGELLVHVPIDEDRIKHMPDRATMKRWSRQNEFLKSAVEYWYEGNYEKSAIMFEKAFGLGTDTKNLAYDYGRCLFRIGQFKKALLVWDSVPESEEHKYLDLLRGSALYILGRHDDAILYLERAVHTLKPSDPKYWPSKAILILSGRHNSTVEQFFEESQRFCDRIDQQLSDLQEPIGEKAGKNGIDSVRNTPGVASRKEAGFVIMAQLAKTLGRNKRFQDSLKIAYKAAEYLQGKSQSVLDINERVYLQFLGDLTRSLKNVEAENREPKRLNALLESIETDNLELGADTIADMAMLIRSFYGDSKTTRALKKGKFQITYLCRVNADRGLKRVYVDSSSYLLGQKQIDFNGEKEYVFNQTITLNRDLVLDARPYCKLHVENILGNKNTPSSLYPFIFAL